MTCDGHAFSSLPMCAGLHERMTDEGLRALASAGCGENLTKLDLSCECSCVLVLI